MRKSAFAKFFGKKVRPIRRATARPRLEVLEDRRVPAFDFTFNGQNLGPGPFRAAGDIDIGDINGDGIPDSVNTNWQGTDFDRINIWLGTNGRGNFAQQADVVSNANLGGIRLGDLNNDGKLDLVYTGRDSGTLRSRLGNGDGTFGSEASVGNVTNATSPLLNNLRLADMDGDGKLDAVVGDANSGVRVMKGDGNGGFASSPWFTADGNGVNSLNVLDISGDGAPDIVTATRVNADILTYANLRGTPVFGGGNVAGGLDANTQMVVANAGAGLGIVFAFVEQPANSQPGRLVFGRNPASPTDVGVFSTPRVGWGKPAIGDFDADGVADLAVTYVAGGVNPSTMQLHAGTTGGVPFGTNTGTVTVGITPFEARSYDVNADGNLDLLVGALGRAAPYDDYSVFINNQQSLVVSTTADENDGNARWNGGTGTSLREAIAYAGNLGGARTVTFAPFLGNANAVVNVTGGVIVTRPVGTTNITVANTRGRITIDGNNTASTIVVGGSSTLTLRDLTVRNFRSGSAFGTNGGAVWVDFDGRLNVDRVTFTNNTATGLGGAIYVSDFSYVDIRNSTFTGNTGDGAIAVNMSFAGPVVLENNTISGNNGGLRVPGGPATLRNNIIAGNGPADVTGSVNGTNNVVLTGTTAGLTGTITADPLLNPLANNGGFADTMSLRVGSPALNAATTLAGVPTDQRGIARPQGSAPDIGAFEARIGSATFNPPSIDVYANAQPVNLAQATNPNPAGGVFSGPGVSNGFFNPAGFPLGPVTVTYTTPGSDIGTPLTVNVLEAPRLSSATVVLGQVGGAPVEGVPFTLRADVGYYRDQYGNRYYPSSGSFTLTMPGQSPQTMTPSGFQLSLEEFGHFFNPVTYAQNATYTFVTTLTLDGVTLIHTHPYTIANFAPSMSSLSAPSSVNQGQAFTLSGSFNDPGTQDTHTVTIDWGDGSANTVLTLPLGQRTFTADKTYAVGYGGSTNHTITVTVRDSDGGTTSLTRPIGVTRNNQFVVTTTADQDDGTADPGFGGTSLREALRYAESHAGPDTVTFASPLAGQTVTVVGGWNGSGDDSALRVAGDLTLDGGSGVTINLASPTPRRTFLSGGGTFVLRNLTLSGGDIRGADNGGALWTNGTVALENVRFTNNRANNGGAVQNFGTMTVTGCTFDNNSTAAGGDGGAINNVGSSLTVTGGTFTGNAAFNGAAVNSDNGLSVTGSSFTSNSASFNGGALRLFGTSAVANSTIANNSAANGGGGLISHGNTTLTNTTVAGNQALDGGGAQFFEGSAGLRHVTVAGNTATRSGGGTAVNFADVTLTSSLVAGNAAPDQPNLWGAPLNAASAGNVLYLSAAAAGLGTLAANGGPTQTVALLPGSPAVNAGVAVAGLTADQRGVPHDARPDAGAFEFVDFLPQTQVTTTLDEDNGTADPAFGTGTSLREALRFAQADFTATGFGVNGSGWTLNHAGGGSPASVTGSLGTLADVLTITTAQQGQANSAWLNRKVNVTRFTANFRYAQDAGANGADGFTLTFQNAGLNAVGGSGSGLGYRNIGQSVAFAFNIYNGGPVPGFAVYTGGTVNGVYTPVGNGVSLTNGQPVDITVAGNGTGVTLTLTQGGNTFTTTFAGLDIAALVGGGTAYVGFTGATGGAVARQQISSFTLTAAPASSTVTFAPSLGGQTVLLNTGWNAAADASALRVASAVTIQGLTTAPGVTIGMAPGVQKRHLYVESGGNLTVNDLTFTSGYGADYGGSIWSRGSLTVRNSTFTGNYAGGEGGAIQTWGGSPLLHIENTTIAGNTTGNLASALGIGSVASTLDHVTIVDNVAPAANGTLWFYQTAVTVRNTVVARNTNDGVRTDGGTGSGTFAAASANNLLGSGGWTGLTDGANGNRLGVTAAQLNAGTLADNGGPTRTVALLPGSYALNAGTNPTGLAFDQRGEGFARVFGPAADVGAFELQSVPPPAPRVTGVAINAGQADADQRSRVTSITVTFDAEVTFTGAVADAFGLSRIGGGAVGGFTASAAVVNGVTVVTLSGFTGDETEFGSLADGRFLLTVRADQVSVGGVRLDGDGNGLAGDDYSLDGTVANGLFRLFGDADGSGTVNAFDYGEFRLAYGSSAGESAYLDWLDIDGDGVINAFDYGRFRDRYGASVP